MNAEQHLLDDHEPDLPPEPPKSQRWQVHVPYLVVMGAVVIGFVLIMLYRWRMGSGAIAGALLLAATFRAVLPPERCGLLVIRTRLTDIVTYGGLGLLITYVALTIT
ncbi:Protein of unknown function [Allokutzneria albata]|uniref:DUF3017 domain-containing protein n=1 Tax=Allokutzneria albata TaxID=211114 RepID=A0A1G9YVB6_ALLAB|nr:Protein of unknown function [Allokutzneria albata]